MLLENRDPSAPVSDSPHTWPRSRPTDAPQSHGGTVDEALLRSPLFATLDTDAALALLAG